MNKNFICVIKYDSDTTSRAIIKEAIENLPGIEYVEAN